MAMLFGWPEQDTASPKTPMQWHRILIEKFDEALVERWLLIPVTRIFVCRNGGDLNVTTL